VAIENVKAADAVKDETYYKKQTKMLFTKLNLNAKENITFQFNIP